MDVTDHSALIVEGVHTAILVIMVDGGQCIFIAHAVQTVGIVVTSGGFGLRLAVHPLVHVKHGKLVGAGVGGVVAVVGKVNSGIEKKT